MSDESTNGNLAARESENAANVDTTSFWKLWEEHEKFLYRICLHQLDGIEEEAEDALSVLMVKLLDLLPRYEDRIQNLRAWLARITYNLCIDIRREIQRKRNLESIDELADSIGEAFVSSAESPEEATLRLETRRYIFQAIEELSVKLRAPFLLHHLYALPYDEIAVRLELSPENARKRSQLARLVLQESLEKYFSGNTRLSPKRDQKDFDGCLLPSGPAEPSAPVRQTAMRLVNVFVKPGVERSFCLHLNHRPSKLYPKIERVTRYTVDHPGGWKKRLELAQLLFEAGEWPSAIQQYQQVLERQPCLLRAYFDLGNVHDLMDNKLASIDTYERALQIAGEPATRHHLKGLIELRQGNYGTAVTEFLEATQIQPDQVGHWHNLAMTHVLRDSPLEALGSFKESLKIDPGDEKALTYLPELLRELGRVSEAERYVGESLRLRSENVLSIKSLADYRCQRRLVFGNQGRKTLGLIKDALRIAGESPQVQESLALFHLCRGEWDKGVSVLRGFANQHQLLPAAWYHYAKALLQTGDHVTAAEAIKQGQSLDPDSWKISLLACRIFSYQGATPELRTLIEDLVEKFPERWTTWAKAGWALMIAFNEPEAACVTSAQAPRLQPELPDSWFQHSKVLGVAGRYEEAIAAAEVGWRWLPEDEDGSQSVPAAFRLAENYILINATERAEIWIGEASRRVAGLITFRPAHGYFWEGKLLELAGDRRGATTAFVNAVKHHLFYPDRAEAEASISRLTAASANGDRSFNGPLNFFSR
jgi:RNA polymerase sigma factor (sigma-70 family)